MHFFVHLTYNKKGPKSMEPLSLLGWRIPDSNWWPSRWPSGRSSQLNFFKIKSVRFSGHFSCGEYQVENTRFELVASCMPCKRSSQLS